MSDGRAVAGAPWLGEVPGAWTDRPLWTMFRREKRTGFVDEPMVSVFRDHGVVFKDDFENLNVTATDRSIYQLVEPGWLVVNRMKAWQGSLGVSRIRGISSGHYLCFRPTHGEHLGYLNWLLRSTPYRDGLAQLSRGVRPGQAEIDNDLLRGLPILLPPLAEQKLIADFLDRETGKIDALIEKQTELITRLHERRESMILTTTEGWRGESFRAVRTRYLVDVGTGSGDTQDADPDGTFPFYVRSDTPLRSASFEFNEPAVLTAGDGAGVGKVFHLVEGKFMAHQRVYVLRRFRGVAPAYFYYSFAPRFARVARDGSAKSTVDSVRRSMITDLAMEVPPPEVQLQIVEYLDRETARIDELIGKTERMIELSKERRFALITAAVTGQIDVNEHGGAA